MKNKKYTAEEKNTLNQFLKEVFEMYEYDRANYSEEYNPNTCYEGAFDSVWDVWKSEKRKLPQFKFNRLKRHEKDTIE